jgi:hypothetical protein
VLLNYVSTQQQGQQKSSWPKQQRLVKLPLTSGSH